MPPIRTLFCDDHHIEAIEQSLAATLNVFVDARLPGCKRLAGLPGSGTSKIAVPEVVRGPLFTPATSSDFVGGRKQRRRHAALQRLGGLEVDDQIELRR